MEQKIVNLGWRDLNISYNIDLKSVAALAEQYGIDFNDMKSALRSYGFTIRKGEVKPTETKSYKVILTDQDKVVKEEALVVNPVTVVQA